MVIAIDFDGTLAEHKYPRIGNEIPHAFRVLKELQAAGHKLILLTMRHDDGEQDGPTLSDAVKWCKERGIEFWAVNDNPEQSEWTGSRKVYANKYIDDNAIGCPLLKYGDERPYVDWQDVREHLVYEGILK